MKEKENQMSWKAFWDEFVGVHFIFIVLFEIYL